MEPETLELLNWVAERPRTYGETMAAWQTFYPHMPIWEDASRDGLVTLLAGDGESNAARVCLTPIGRAARDRRPIRVSILDDYFDTLHTLPASPSWRRSTSTIWNDHVEDVDVLAERLEDSRSAGSDPRADENPRAAAERLPKLRLISQRSVYPHIDVDACTRQRRDRVVEPARGHAVLCRRRADLGAGARGDAADSGTGRRARGRARGKSASADACAERRSASTATAGSAKWWPATARRSA